VPPGIVVSTREKGGGDAFFQKRVPRGAPEWVRTARIDFPSGRHADEVCPSELAVVAWAAQMGTITFHPWPVREEESTIPTSCGSIWIRRRAPTSTTRLLDLYERDAAEGEADMPYPPSYPKMPGDPKRVQPSRDAEARSGRGEGGGP